MSEELLVHVEDEEAVNSTEISAENAAESTKAETNTEVSGITAEVKPDSNKQKIHIKIPFGLSKKLFAVFCVLLAAVIALGSVLTVVIIDANRIKPHKAVYDKDSEQTTAKAGDKVNFYNYDVGYAAIPAIEGVPVSTYDDDNFRTDSKGLKCYYEDGELASYAGIDVSTYNGEIDFEAVKEYGIDFVIVRIGGRGYGAEGVIFEDDCFYRNIKEAKAAGLMVGAYFFSQAISAEEAVEEAEFCLEKLDGMRLDYPLVFDWEQVDSAENPRTLNIKPETLTECARAFCDTVSDKGYTPCIYTDSKKAYMKFDMSRLSDIDIWYAFYNDSPSMYYNYMMWQYTSTGKVDGIEGDVDLNICFKNYK